MKSFLTAELDYIYFVYGLSFFILATVCAMLSRKQGERLPWRYLGLFACVHGINEWLDMLAFVTSDSAPFMWTRLVILVASFVFLFEFGRRGLEVLNTWSVSRIIYVPVGLGILLSTVMGTEVATITARYLMGFTGALAAAFVFYAFRSLKTRSKGPLAAAGASFVVYALATGIVVPRADLFPARLVNYESFMAVFGYPVQLLRCVAASVISAAIWVYFRRETVTAEGRMMRRAERLNRVVISILAVIIAAGWLLTHYLGSVRKSDLVDNARTDAKRIVNNLLFEIQKSDQVARALGTSTAVAAACGSPKDARTVADVNMTLKWFATAFEEGVCYLIGTNGTTFASSNVDTPTSFVGKSYAFRPYFKEAMGGRPGRYFALGVTSGERGYYASFPVKDSAGQVTGVVVVKHSLVRFQQRIQGYPYCFFIDPNGIIFMAGDVRFLNRALWPIEGRVLRSIVASKQFGDGPFTPVLDRMSKGRDEVRIGGEGRYVIRVFLEDTGWSVVNMVSLGAIYLYRLFGIIVSLFICMLVVGFMNIITLREDLLRLVEAERDKAWAYFDIAGAILVVLDADGTVIDINRRGCEVLGYPRDEIAGKSWTRHFVPDRARHRTETTIRDLVAGRPAGDEQSEIPIIPRSGLERIVVWRNAVIRTSAGRAVHILSAGEDVTDIRRSELQLKESFETLKRTQAQLVQTSKMASIGQLASGVAHEINNPLTGLLNNIQLIKMEASLRKDFDIAQFSGLIDVIEESALKCKKITKSLLDFAEPSKHLSASIDLTQTAYKVYELICHEYELDNIAIIPELDATVPEVSADEQLIKQVIFDIVANARWAIQKKFGEKGGRIILRTFFDARQRMSAVSVADDGIGIESEYIGKIFDPFFTTKGVGEGTGLGLSVDYNIIKSHGGRIEVSSEKGKGSVFTVWLPVERQKRST